MTDLIYNISLVGFIAGGAITCFSLCFSIYMLNHNYTSRR